MSIDTAALGALAKPTPAFLSVPAGYAEPVAPKEVCVVEMNPIEVQKHLKGMSYPASKDDLVSTAERNGADEGLLGQLRDIDRNDFSGPDDVMEALKRS